MVCEMAYGKGEILEVDIFCYYDGDDESEGIDSMGSAKSYAKKKGYTVSQ